jgi:hypothetical protein
MEEGLSLAAIEALSGQGPVERIPLKDIHRILNALKITPEEYREFHRLFSNLNSALLNNVGS